MPSAVDGRVLTKISWRHPETSFYSSRLVGYLRVADQHRPFLRQFRYGIKRRGSGCRDKFRIVPGQIPEGNKESLESHFRSQWPHVEEQIAKSQRRTIDGPRLFGVACRRKQPQRKRSPGVRVVKQIAVSLWHGLGSAIAFALSRRT